MAQDGTAPLRTLREVLCRALKFEKLSVADRASLDQLIAEANEALVRGPSLDTALSYHQYAAHLESLARRARQLLVKYNIAGAS